MYTSCWIGISIQMSTSSNMGVSGWYQGRYGKFYIIIYLSHILHWLFSSIDFYIGEKNLWTDELRKKLTLANIFVMNIGRVNIEFFRGWKKIKQRRKSFFLGYLRMILWTISTAIYRYGFLTQSLALILGNIFFLLA
jgi:hypothetical protein